MLSLMRAESWETTIESDKITIPFQLDMQFENCPDCQTQC